MGNPWPCIRTYIRTYMYIHVYMYTYYTYVPDSISVEHLGRGSPPLPLAVPLLPALPHAAPHHRVVDARDHLQHHLVPGRVQVVHLGGEGRVQYVYTSYRGHRRRGCSGWSGYGLTTFSSFYVFIKIAGAFSAHLAFMSAHTHATQLPAPPLEDPIGLFFLTMEMQKPCLHYTFKLVPKPLEVDPTCIRWIEPSQLQSRSVVFTHQFQAAWEPA